MIVFRAMIFLMRLAWWLLSRLAAGLAFVARASRTDYRSLGALGTARWASAWEAFTSGVFRGVGPVIGQGRFGQLMRFNHDGIVHVFARTGAGKGIGIVVPTLLDYPGSIVVADVKGENFAITARHRAKRGDVVKLDPSDLARSARFNPMDTIRVGTDQESDDARALAALMVVRDSAEVHWADKSTSLLAAFILHALHDPDPVNRTLAHVRRLSLGGDFSMHETIEDIATSSPSALAQSIARATRRAIGRPDKPPDEFSSILSDLDKATEPWSEGTPTGTLSASSTFRLEDLNGPKVLTLYLCVDEEKLESYKRWLRVMTGCTLNALMRSKRTQRPRHKVVLLLDEVRALGRLDPLVNAMGFLRAYCTPVLIWQNMPQVRAAYGQQADEFLANASCRVFFGIQDNDTAYQVSLMCGQTGIRTQSRSVSQASDAWQRENRSHGESEGGYWLIDPSEVQRLPDTVAIVKMGHVPFPLLTGRANYLTRWAWTGRYDRWAPGARDPGRLGPPAPPPGAPARDPSPAQAGGRAASPPPGAARALPQAGAAL